MGLSENFAEIIQKFALIAEFNIVQAKFQLNSLRSGTDIGCLEFLWWWGGGVVDTDALPSSSPSLIWLSWGFGLAWAVTILYH